MTLMKKIEETEKKAIYTVKTDGQENEKVTDKNQVLAFKNLPNIRGKLSTIKTRWQKAIKDPKYNGASAPGISGFHTLNTETSRVENDLDYTD